ncbi:Sc6p-like [Cryptosporidium bovis]|uniref:Sc6p-like n=1 Tax=Cryptosporidium bovis TaxID=310047 RepID=UPI00351A8C15|nr:Sc6p-like [Cryptosporidium bovis]
MVHEYIGSKITIISRNSRRYEGVLHSIDVDKSTITLKDVRYFENNENGEPTPASSTVFEMIVFRGSDITDLAVCQPVEEKTKNHVNIPHDPAIISITEGGGKTLNNNKNQTVQQNNNNSRSNASVKNNTESSKLPNNTLSNGNKIQFGSSANSNSGKSKNNPAPNGRNRYRSDNTRGRQRNTGSSGRNNYRSGNNSNYRGSGGHHQRSFVVGELKAKVNQALKAELDTEFDFSEQNKKFEKTFGKDLAVDEKLNEIKIGVSESGVDNESSMNGVTNKESNNASGENSSESGNTLKVGGYNKVSGFFDSISCETLDPDRSKRVQGSSDPQMKALREKQKMIDKETFGTSFVRPRGSYRNNNRRGRNRNNGRRE